MSIVLEETDYHGSLNDEAARIVKCSWCGEIIECDGKVLAVAMCQACHTKMPADFQKAQQHLSSPYASDR
jgi:hypothetical protein